MIGEVMEFLFWAIYSILILGMVIAYFWVNCYSKRLRKMREQEEHKPPFRMPRK